MEYNKRQFSKTNDKKVLRKIGKQWKTVSVALLMAIGGTAIATHVSHASANTNNNQNNNTNQVTNNQSNDQRATLVNTSKVSNTNNSNTSQQPSSTNSQNITQQASNLHKQILLNSVNKQVQQNQSSEVPVLSESKANSSASVSSNVSQSASSATNGITPKVNNVGDQQNNNNITYGTYAGMNYKYNKQNKSVEFTSGTMENHAKFHNANNPYDYDLVNSVPNIISSAKAIKFDDDINTNKLSDTNDMFYSDDNLTSLILPKGFGEHIINASYMFAFNGNLTSLTLPSGFGQDITNARQMFDSDCDLSLTLPSGFGRNITNAYGMFMQDESIQTLPSGFGQNITNAQYMFRNSNIPSLPLGFGQNIINAISMFSSNQSSYGEMTLPKGFGKKIVYANGMFGLNSDLQSLVLPAGFGKNITNADEMFVGDEDLSSLTLPKGFGQNITNADGMFGLFKSDGVHLGKSIPLFLKDNNDNYTSSTPMNTHNDVKNINYRPYDYSGTPNNPYALAGTWVSKRNPKPATPTRTSTISYYDIYNDVDGMSNPASKTVSGNMNSLYNYSSKDIPNGYALVNSDGQIIKPTGNFKFYSDTNTNHGINHVLDVAPVYAGMTYKYEKNNNSVEFVNGTMKNGTEFSHIHIPSEPSTWDLRSITIDSDVNTNNVTNANAMFVGLNLDNISLPNNFGKNIVDANNMFAKNIHLTKLNLPQGFGKNISDASEMFDDTGVKSLNLPSGFGENIHKANHMFSYVPFLNTLILPNNFGKNITNAVGMFGSDDAPLYLKDINDNYTSSTPMATHVGIDTYYHYGYDGTPNNPHNLAGTWVSKRNPKPATPTRTSTISYHDIYSDVDGMKNPASKTVSGNINSLYNYSSKDIPNGYALVNSGGKIINPTGSFKFSSNNTNHVLKVAPVYAGMTYKYNKKNNSVEFVNGTMKNGTKFDCSSNYMNKLSNIFNPISMTFDSDVNTSKVSDANDMFNGSFLRSLVLPKGFGKNISDTEQMFNQVNDLQSLTLPQGFGQHITNAWGMFNMAEDLQSLTLPQGFGKNISDAQVMFSITGLQSLTLPQGFGKNISDAKAMFAINNHLQSLTLPQGFGQHITDARGMFSDVTELEKLIIPQGFGRNLLWGKDWNNYSDCTGMFNGTHPLYLKNSYNKYTLSNPMSTHTTYSDGDSYYGTPDNPHKLAGTWVSKRNPKPAVTNPYSSIYHDSYIANQDMKAVEADLDNDTKYADRDVLHGILADGEQVNSDQASIKTDLLNNNTSALSNANQQVSLANSATNNASSLYNDAKGVASMKYSTIYNKSYDAYYDASVASNDANENIIKNNANASAQVNNDAMMINSARSAINADYATYNVSSASTEDSIAKNALNDANSLYHSMSNQNSASASANYKNIYNAYYNASYASSAESGLAKNSNVTDNASLSANVAKDTSIESSAMSAIMHDFSVNNTSAINDANLQEQKAHNAWTDANNVIYSANVQANNTIYYVTYVDNSGNTVLHKAIQSLNIVKQFVPFGYSFDKVASSSVINGKHVMTIDVIPEF